MESGPMAFDEQLAERVRAQLGKRSGLSEKTMFGGLAFLLNGNMCCGVHEQELIVRLEPAATDAALARPHTRVFDLSGRPMKGWILVEPAGLDGDSALASWVGTALDFASTLPKK
jgi:TfoX/Sxy family transcriptional regulator of competence genes